MCRPNKVKCFVCGEWFSKSEMNVRCEECGDWKCINCNGCMCNLSDEGKRVALSMIQTYEKFLTELTQINYDFSSHEKLIREIISHENRARI